MTQKSPNGYPFGLLFKVVSLINTDELDIENQR